MKRGEFTKFEGVDLKEHGFYLVVDDKTGKVVFRFYVAPNQRRKTGANRTLLRIKRREHEPSAMVALLDSASLYFVAHDKIKNLFGFSNLTGTIAESAIQMRFGDGENYTEYNRALNDLFDFEFQPY
ncbi:nuclear desruption protein [Escherichia phage Lw1]|nr:Ndd-like nucleoid disruption protein [Escherichia phage Lw1]YP_009218727.1 Ndd-like nucleoid disruption protein [Citrobacter phage IME-CF2]YP_009285810.1 Ndd-like nucleoid disruption protein [Citrobacter phage vB_CfrM_CfP1]QJI10837.1 nuclear disruption protein [Buttiauxella phage vB_ButM_GuL6]QPX73136.1 putative Ndd nuclear disruption protein [Citrobacter phage vB_Cfr_Xman]CCK74132.1 protein of unknown function [Pseudotevenvirus RB43]AGJ71680.1 nuclear desruption protein [Escherichia phage